VVVEARLCDIGQLEVSVQVRTGTLLARQDRLTGSPLLHAYLNTFSSSITCIPCSYCSLVGASPTPAKWPLTVIIEGAVG